MPQYCLSRNGIFRITERQERSVPGTTWIICVQIATGDLAGWPGTVLPQHDPNKTGTWFYPVDRRFSGPEAVELFDLDDDDQARAVWTKLCDISAAHTPIITKMSYDVSEAIAEREYQMIQLFQKLTGHQVVVPAPADLPG